MLFCVNLFHEKPYGGGGFEMVSSLFQKGCTASTNLQSLWSKALADNLTVAQLAKELPDFMKHRVSLV
jgi:hypothetical protein